MKRIDTAKKSNSFRIEFITLLEKYNAEITVTNTDGMTITFELKAEPLQIIKSTNQTEAFCL